jgi:apolipoprotein N-acyltransferase
MRVDRRLARDLTVAFALGLVHAVSLSWPGLWWLQMLAFGGLALVLASSDKTVSHRSVKQSRLRCAATGFAFGIAWFGAGVAWLFISMNRYGGMPAPLAGLALLLFCAYLALFPTLACALFSWISADRSQPPWAAAATLCGALTLTEMLRGWLFTGFPWLSPGYAHVDGPFAALAPWLGVYGVSAAACLVSGLVSIGLGAIGSGSRRMLPPLALALGITLLALSAKFVSWGEPAGEALRVDLIQGNVAQDLKFNPERTLAAMQTYTAAIEPGRADLVVLPETAWTMPWRHTPPDIAGELRTRLAGGTIAAIGMPLPAPEGRSFSNSVAVIDSRGDIVARYDKRHLVPFGEFIPPGFAWFVALMNIPLGEFQRGTANQTLLRIHDHAIAFNICYEDLFGTELSEQVRAGANLLINASNIAWFGDSHAPAQHLEISRMRALELARPMLRATNTGITAAIDHQGRVLARLPGYTVGVLSVSVYPTQGLTLFARWGDRTAAALALALLLVAWFGRPAQDGAPADVTTKPRS